MQQQNSQRLPWVAIFLISSGIILGSWSSLPVPAFTSPANESPASKGDTPRNVATEKYSNGSDPEANKPMDVFDMLNLESFGLSRTVFDQALKGMEKLKKRGVINNNILTIADMSQPSTHKRLYVIDLDNDQLLYNTWVAHGRNTGTEFANSFSNKPRSRKSSLGFYVTGETYSGSNGYSLKLNGLEAGFNSNALRRGIVVHGADYVNEDYINSQGYIGRSYGCPAIPAFISSEIIDIIKGGSCLFIYHPNAVYLKRSALLH